MQAMKSLLNQTQLSLQDLQNGHQIATSQMQQQQQHFDPSSSSHHDEDFLDQMLSSLPSSTWPDVNAKSPWDISSNTLGSSDDQFNFDHDQSSMLESKLRHHQISAPESAAKSLVLQQQLMLQARGFGNGGDLVDPSTFNPGGDGSVQALFNGFAGSLNNNQSQFQQQTQSQNFVAAAPAMNQAAAASGSAASGQTRQRVRARRGQATDPHSIAERLRRERISERMKALQELVPNGNKTDKASMLDEIIDYVKFLQLQVKVLSMSRLGGAAPVAPIAAAEGGINRGVPKTSSSNNSGGNEGGTMVTEHQVAKMLEEDMGSAMQYLQGKGLCLMPISLATAISTATCNRNPMSALLAASGRGADSGSGGGGDGGGPSSPNLSMLTVQSGNMSNAVGDASA